MKGESMKRLPKRFEEEVLDKHDIVWDDEEMTKFSIEMAYGISYGETSPHYSRKKSEWNGLRQGRVSKYELAGIAIEELSNLNYHTNGMPSYDGYAIDYDYATDPLYFDKDFCSCVFKAVQEIWGDK
jgi:hypothetical protein